MATLKQGGAQLASGDPTFCKQCHAAFNIFSVIQQRKTLPQLGEAEPLDEQVWTCEFCNTENEVNLEPEEIPTTQQMNYVLEAAPAQQVIIGGGGATSTDQAEGKKDITVVFAVDISGSMCVTKEIQGKHQIKGDRIRSAYHDLMRFSDGSD